ncbi:cotranscriptional regulator FAM172A isoform X2 [Aricia agestis]|uniref:cotranscriptional regulator FAM172A isoform X2 n=1 Tax=Aricia agestis TaxID=91739 RepID=UPI001C2074A3|nr:cotranscriptional regulator FAM172A isoform X2 [Aricia agestis]
MKVFRRIKAYITPQHLKNQYCVSKIYCEKMAATKTLADLGYAFNSEGQLRKICADGKITDEPFQFNISKDHQQCQSHYETLGEAVTEYIYQLLETQENLVRLPVPKDSTEDFGTFIFTSKDYDKKPVVMVLIHGSGAVRAGQWARSLIINENLDMGTQIPYIKEATARDYGIIVLNPNDNTRNDKIIMNSSNSEEHSKYVWEHYIRPCSATSIVIVAHSFGGYLTLMLSDMFRTDFEQRVKAVALTDSVHRYSRVKMNVYLKTQRIGFPVPLPWTHQLTPQSMMY